MLQLTVYTHERGSNCIAIDFQVRLPKDYESNIRLHGGLTASHGGDKAHHCVRNLPVAAEHTTRQLKELDRRVAGTLRTKR